jgi:formamidopyrimidine-DNA glycosylase
LEFFAPAFGPDWIDDLGRDPTEENSIFQTNEQDLVRGKSPIKTALLANS